MRVLRLYEVARAYLRQAKARLKDAKEVFLERNCPYTVRLSQECVELSLKVALKAVGIEHSKVHDVLDVMLEVKGRFPSWFTLEVG